MSLACLAFFLALVWRVEFIPSAVDVTLTHLAACYYYFWQHQFGLAAWSSPYGWLTAGPGLVALLGTGQCTSLAAAVACFESVCGPCGRNEAAMMMMTMLMLAVAWAVAAQISICIKKIQWECECAGKMGANKKRALCNRVAF